MGLISLSEYAEKHGVVYSTAKRRARMGLLETAVKAGQMWVIEETEPWVDNLKRGLGAKDNADTARRVRQEKRSGN